MVEKRMMIVDAEVVRKVDENRGDMTHSEFIDFLIKSCLKEDPGTPIHIGAPNYIEAPNYITKEDFKEFRQGTRELLRNFLEFFISYGLELDKQPQDKTFEELTKTLQALSNSDNNSN
jgi:hypothetical protein